jgi:hypothetical protein
MPVAPVAAVPVAAIPAFLPVVAARFVTAAVIAARLAPDLAVIEIGRKGRTVFPRGLALALRLARAGCTILAIFMPAAILAATATAFRLRTDDVERRQITGIRMILDHRDLLAGDLLDIPQESPFFGIAEGERDA